MMILSFLCLMKKQKRMSCDEVMREKLVSCNTTNYIDIAPQSEISIKGIDEAIEDISKGRITTYENFEAYKEGMRKYFEILSQQSEGLNMNNPQ